MSDDSRFDEIRFQVQGDGADAPQIRVKINGVDLVHLVGLYETAQGFDPAGGYGGLIPAYYQFGPMTDHFLGRGATMSSDVPVLGCDCGEWGCWPLMVNIAADDVRVQWSHFGQPHRPGWDYGTFGPMSFRRMSYDIALRELEDQLLRSP